MKVNYTTSKSMNKMVKKQMAAIIVNHGAKRILVKELKSNYLYVNQALNGEKLTPTALAIRAKALELGGIEIE